VSFNVSFNALFLHHFNYLTCNVVGVIFVIGKKLSKVFLSPQ